MCAHESKLAGVLHRYVTFSRIDAFATLVDVARCGGDLQVVPPVELGGEVARTVVSFGFCLAPCLYHFPSVRLGGVFFNIIRHLQPYGYGAAGLGLALLVYLFSPNPLYS